eukprot:TRINITY_DN24528_c0_g1_i1.p1 TRINITY_DN24528_c0_g1~~TRINITY_DN24528_c0_g1_i1.p1  ORF type:complete len:235 (+),score=70.23 TRINITY_DN24528_c0_g1_i1:60-764(+)
MDASNWLVTGATRGIGLRLARGLLERGLAVVATYRTEPTEALKALSEEFSVRLRLAPLDVTSDASVDALFDSLRRDKVALAGLINNAGIFPKHEGAFGLNTQVLSQTLDVNAIAPVRVASRAIPLLTDTSRPVLVNISSSLGSIELRSAHTDKSSYSYNMSKAALNMLTKMLSLEHERLCVVSIHPGWVQTDMGGANADLTVEQSATGILDVVHGLSMADSGRFFNWKGEPMPW